MIFFFHFFSTTLDGYEVKLKQARIPVKILQRKQSSSKIDIVNSFMKYASRESKDLELSTKQFQEVSIVQKVTLGRGFADLNTKLVITLNNSRFVSDQ